MILTDKRALITGGTKGIGAAVAIDLARQGCDVAINGRYDDAESAATRQAIESAGRRCAVVVADVAKPAEAERAVREAAERLGGGCRPDAEFYSPARGSVALQRGFHGGAARRLAYTPGAVLTAARAAGRLLLRGREDLPRVRIRMTG